MVILKHSHGKKIFLMTRPENTMKRYKHSVENGVRPYDKSISKLINCRTVNFHISFKRHSYTTAPLIIKVEHRSQEFQRCKPSRNEGFTMQSNKGPFRS